MNNQLLQQEIQQKPTLPVLPPGVSSLLKVLNDDNISYQELAGNLEKFPTIALKVVATANSAWASPVTPITSLRDACSRIGLPIVRSISIALSVSQVFDPSRCKPFDAKVFWVSALLSAEATHMCAKDLPDICPHTARLAGLLSNIGLLWLAENWPDETAQAIDMSQSDEAEPLTRTLSESYGIDLNSVGGVVATALELPQLIASVIAADLTASHDDIEKQLIINHRHARELVRYITGDMENDDVAQHIIEDPQLPAVRDKLPGIKAMAEALFF